MTEQRNGGLFLTFEGIDGCGKTTQMALLAEKLRAEGYDVLESAEPGGTPIGNQIRRVLLDSANQELAPTTELLLYFACRAQNVDELILPALREGKIVISDRFTDSTMVYQGAARGLGEDVVRDLDRIACRGLEPDLTIYIDIDLETSLARAHDRNRGLEGARAAETRMDEQSADFHRRVREAYESLAEREAHRFRKVDGRQPVESLAKDVWLAVTPLLERRRV